MTTISLGGGRSTVAGNRWDLLSAMTSRPVSVAVVIPYYNQQADLDLVLTALNSQTYPSDLIQVIVADDGSSEPPRVGTAELPTTIVRQADYGFRAAAARNLGAAAASAEVLCFLDADTIPEPDYIRQLVRLPSLCPDALVVGRRRHADFAEWTPQRLSRWLRGAEGLNQLTEPRWLTDGYLRSNNLLELDHASYRYVISAVMCCSAELFEDIGGFDEGFRQYGGEDWEFAHRAIVGGAVLQHVDSAVAWHDGPDWAERDVPDRANIKNSEALTIARLVPDPDLRVSGTVNEFPAVAVEIDGVGHDPLSLLAVIGGFDDLDVGIWMSGQHADSVLGELRRSDRRVHSGDIPEAVLRRCSHVISVAGRAVLHSSAVAELVEHCRQPGMGSVSVRDGSAAMTCVASWARNRARRWRRAESDTPADIARFGTVTELSSRAMGLRSGEPSQS